jgi:hypothetical protein
MHINHTAIELFNQRPEAFDDFQDVLFVNPKVTLTRHRTRTAPVAAIRLSGSMSQRPAMTRTMPDNSRVVDFIG